MASDSGERRLGNGLLAVGVAMAVGYLPFGWSHWLAALLPVAAAAVVLYVMPLGNRLLAAGLSFCSALLVVALWRFDVFFGMLVTLVGVILVLAGILKHRGKW